MLINIVPWLIAWIVLAVVVILLLVWRNVVSRSEDDTLHVSDAEVLIPQQKAIAAKLEKIDRWGKILTIVAVVTGLALAGAYVYNVWIQTSRTVITG